MWAYMYTNNLFSESPFTMLQRKNIIHPATIMKVNFSLFLFLQHEDSKAQGL